MSLTVLSVAYPFAPVGPAAVGGAEQILGELDRALVAAGHRSIVVACEGSRPSGTLVPIPGPYPQVLDREAQAACRRRVQQVIDAALATHSVDLVHMHCLDFAEYRIPAGVPVLVTLHLPISWYRADAWTRLSHYRFCCVSQAQRRTCPPELDAVVVENGVPLPPEPIRRTAGEYALVLGRICPEKNAHEALEAGTRAGVPVWVAGHVFPYPEHLEYFREKVEPLVNESRNGVQHRFLGRLGPEERTRVLSGARCLLHPTLAPETSSLVAMESLAAATPVIAYPSGALPEIVEDGVTGFLVRGVDGMAAAMGGVSELRGGACRRAAEQRFDSRRMVERYLGLYEQIAHAAQPEVLSA